MDNNMERGTETILLADDGPLVRNMLTTLLRTQGYHVLAASNGNEALQTAQDPVHDGIQLLLTDIVMPQMDGIELATQFKMIFPKAKIILMSGYTEKSVPRHLIAQPNVGFLEKPFPLQVLTHKVREMLDRPI
jgi:CheY-like chemotaxis protein